MTTATERLPITVDQALSAIRADYYSDVRDCAESIKDELEDRLKNQECGEPLREWLLEHIHETIDGQQRVIYTQQAMLGVISSDNDGAYVEDFGEEGMVEDGCIMWSRLCFAAMERDVIEHLESDDVDVNEPVPPCFDCDDNTQDERYWNSTDDVWLCECCRDERENRTEG